MDRKSAVLIAGPTASGKSALALEIAAQTGGIIINADSMQVYRDLRVITARPTDAEMAAALATQEVRDRLGLDEGTRIEWVVEGDHAIVKPRKLRAVDLAGILHRPGMKPVSIEEMDEAIGRVVAEDDERIRREWNEAFAKEKRE